MVVIKNPFFIGYLIVYLISLLLLNSSENFSITDSLAILIIVGVAFSGIVFLLTKSSKPMHVTVRSSKAEMLVMLLCLILVTSYLTWGKDALNVLLLSATQDSPFINLLLDLIQKLIFFVAIPLFVFRKFFGYSVRDFGIQFRGNGTLWKSHLPVLIGMASILILFNYFLGQGAQPIRQGQFTTAQLTLGMPLGFLWLALEVGLVEEFFFRAFIQSRLAVFFKSELAGIIMTCLVFGLAHAPGLFLRGAGAATPLGDTPSIIQVVAYSIAILSVTGFFLGLIWARTKNLVVLMLIHAAGDLLASFPEFVAAFHIKCD